MEKSQSFSLPTYIIKKTNKKNRAITVILKTKYSLFKTNNTIVAID
jgi:hypothetical protein